MNSTPEPAAPSVRILHWSLLVTTALKAVLAALVPLTGDEAYFIQWGRDLAGSYYDHGPMTGWWIWVTLLPGDSVWLVRLPAVLSSLLTGWILWRLLRPVHPAKAAWAATAYLWSPPALLSVFMTTDVPLLVFSVLSVAAAVRAHRTDRVRDYLLTGALLGLAFLSKYFAVLLGAAFAGWWLVLSRPRRFRAVLWLLVGVLPFAVQHMYWNFHHSWTNVMFNVLTRQEGDQSAWYNPFVLLLVAAWMIGPAVWIAGRALRRDRGLRAEATAAVRRPLAGLLLAAFAVPHAAFLLVSLSNPIGVHWLLSFQPFIFGMFAAWMAQPDLARAARAMRWFGGAHVALALVVALLPTSIARSHRSYSSIVLGVHPEQVLAALAPYRSEYRLATPSYAKSALLEFHAGEPVVVLGPGSFHGRQDDLRTDFRSLDGENFLILTKPRERMEDARTWFDTAERLELDVDGAGYTVLLGRGFRYERYREDVLQRVADRYYRMPPCLERFSSGCFFRERYGLPPATPLK